MPPSPTLWAWLLLAAQAITALYASLNLAFADNTVTMPLTTPQGQRTLLAVGAGASTPLAAVLGAIGLTGEFRHRTATATFLTIPQRGRVVLAKLLTYATIGAGYGAACAALTVAIARPGLPHETSPSCSAATASPPPSPAWSSPPRCSA